MYSSRLQNLAATLDRAKYFLRHQTPPHQPCLRELTEEEVEAFLWSGAHSVARELCQAVLEKETDVDALAVLEGVREKLRGNEVRGLGRVRRQLRARGRGCGE